MGAHPPVLRGELVNENSREEPVFLKYSEWLVFMNSGSSSACVEGRARHENSREEPVCLKYSEGLVFMNSRSSSVCVEGRARQREQLGSWHCGRVATWPELV